MPKIAEAIILHEMGHGDDFHRHIVQASGDTAKAYTTVCGNRARQLATLPLGIASSHAQRAWDTNAEGYQQRMRNRGHTEESWNAILQSNLVAYTNLEQEQAADRFALDVLAELYP